jgi:alkylhydroperoxidase family enzyme
MSVEKAKQQLEVLQAFTVQKQATVTTVMNLQLAGFSEKEIAELTALVGRWNKRWPGMGPFNQGQGNGSSANGKLDDRLIGN